MVPRVSCSVDIGVSITIILDWVHSMCIISQKVTSRGEKRDERRAGEREGATGVYERRFARDVFEI